jgi:RNA polymerase sigma factor (TIGR02999 family)
MSDSRILKHPIACKSILTNLMNNLTLMLDAIESGQARTEDLLPLVYDELRRMAGAKMQHERAGQTLQATALVHEVFLRLTSGEQLNWQNRRHFFGAAALAMQRILVEQARRRQQLKRGGNLERVDLMDVDVAISGQVSDSELLAIHEAFGAFEKEEPAKAELVRLRYFVGLTEDEAAKTLNISRATASRWWTFSRAWLFQRMQGNETES